MQFLGDEETVRKAMEAVAAQGKAKKWRPASWLYPKKHPPCPLVPLHLSQWPHL
jgi:hypothetical protein